MQSRPKRFGLQDANMLYPFRFQPILVERVWGGQRLAHYGKPVGPNQRIGESWEIADRPAEQSRLANGPWAGYTLHQLVEQLGSQLLGTHAQGARRFPLLIKLLDARERLSLQVHPPPEVARRFGGEPKTEMWYVLEADPGAHLFAGLKRGVTRPQLEEALRSPLAASAVAALLHRLPVRAGDAFFVPAGRVHAIDAGVVLVEIQQNSDTTYRVYDWGRVGLDGQPRALHVTESLASIDFNDVEPALSGFPVTCPFFHVELCAVSDTQTDGCDGTSFHILGCVGGALEVDGEPLRPGEFVLLPAALRRYALRACEPATRYLKIALPPPTR